MYASVQVTFCKTKIGIESQSNKFYSVEEKSKRYWKKLFPVLLVFSSMSLFRLFLLIQAVLVWNQPSFSLGL